MAENDNTFLNANNIYEEVEGEVGKSIVLEEDQRINLVGIIQGRFFQAEEARQNDETRWLKAYENYRGLYAKNIKFRESEKSRIFVKITKTKVLAAFGQLVDVIFGTGKFPIGISETKLPEGDKEDAFLDINNPNPSLESGMMPDNIGNRLIDPPQENVYSYGYEGDGKVLKAGATIGTGMFEPSIEELADEAGMLKEGLTPDPTIMEISPAQRAARRMEKLVHDQIEESNGSSEIRNALLESALLGTGIVKGPFNFNKQLNKWNYNEDGDREYNPLEVRVPRIEFVSCWDFYPDPAATNIDECEYVVHRHKMNKSQLRQLRHMPYFDKDAIRACLQEGANYTEKDFESQLKDDARADYDSTSNFEVLEYWGMMDAEYAREVGIELPESVDDLDEVQINAWICGDKLLRAVINPFTPYRIPYNAFPYERNPYNFFGIGVAENMDDSQQIMNGHARMAIDNLAMAGSLVFDVDESALVGGQNMEIYPGKIFRRQAGMPGQSIYGLKFPNTAPESLMQKEVRSQRLTMFLQTAQNPTIAPFVKISKLVSELAYSLDLDPDEILNDPEEAAMMAQIIGMQNAGQNTGEETQPGGQQPAGMGGAGGVPEGPQELGTTGTGGGNIGTGNVPNPGEDSFSGTIRGAAPEGEGST
jgi:hypothetical protein